MTPGTAQWAYYNSNTHPYLPDGHRYWKINANRTRFALLVGLCFEVDQNAGRGLRKRLCWRSRLSLTHSVEGRSRSWSGSRGLGQHTAGLTSLFSPLQIHKEEEMQNVSKPSGDHHTIVHLICFEWCQSAKLDHAEIMQLKYYQWEVEKSSGFFTVICTNQIFKYKKRFV